jgi:hypothetical protein
MADFEHLSDEAAQLAACGDAERLRSHPRRLLDRLSGSHHRPGDVERILVATEDHPDA